MIFNELAKTIFNDIDLQGGKVYIVGGSVRDYILKKETFYDIDVEIYGLSYESLHDILEKYGHVLTFGKSFAIMQLDCLKGYDFALPRTEKKIGDKHQDFEVIVDPFLPINKAILRRDLTMNALMYDVKEDKIIDMVNGIQDIHDHIIRVVHERTFIEDPLRILRIAQMMSRFLMEVDDNAKALCKKMVQQGMLEHLSKERISQEYNKMLMGEKPSLGILFLNEIGALPPYLSILKETAQRLDYHPEGDVLAHTCLVVDIAALTKHKADLPLSFMWGALLHDIGKPQVTNEKGSAPLHNEAGVEAFKHVDLILNQKMRKEVETFIMYHMHLMNMARRNASDQKYLLLLKKIEGKITLNDLILLSRCDKLGRGAVSYQQYQMFGPYIEDKISRLGSSAPIPLINGHDLIELGIESHSLFRKILNDAYTMQLDGKDKDEILRSVKEKYET